jgi:hypothetical protein
LERDGRGSRQVGWEEVLLTLPNSVSVGCLVAFFCAAVSLPICLSQPCHSRARRRSQAATLPAGQYLIQTQWHSSDRSANGRDVKTRRWLNLMRLKSSPVIGPDCRTVLVCCTMPSSAVPDASYVDTSPTSRPRGTYTRT